MKPITLALILALSTAAHAPLSPTNKLDNAAIHAALSSQQRSVADNYRQCLREEIRAGAAFDNAGEGCAGVWTISYEAIVERVASKFPKLAPSTIRDGVSLYLKHGNDDLRLRGKRRAPNQ